MIYQEIESLKEKIIKTADPELIILFGEKKHLESEKIREVNLCVVVAESDCSGIEKKIYLNVESEIVFNILVYSHDEWQHLKADHTSYVSSIIKKGVLIYEKA